MTDHWGDQPEHTLKPASTVKHRGGNTYVARIVVTKPNPDILGDETTYHDLPPYTPYPTRRLAVQAAKDEIAANGDRYKRAHDIEYNNLWDIDDD